MELPSQHSFIQCIFLKKILSRNSITINSVHPGEVKSNIGSKSGIIYNFYMKHFLSRFLKDPEISANALYYHGLSPELDGTTGNFYNLTNIELPAPHARYSEYSRKIYDKSIEILKEYL